MSKVIEIRGYGDFSQEVVGEASYQENLSKACGGPSRDGVNYVVSAELNEENYNPYDQFAVRIDVKGKTVGYLNRADARQHRNRLIRSGHTGHAVRCKGIIVGGWNRGPNDWGHFGIRLDLPAGCYPCSANSASSLFGLFFAKVLKLTVTVLFALIAVFGCIVLVAGFGWSRSNAPSVSATSRSEVPRPASRQKMEKAPAEVFENKKSPVHPIVETENATETKPAAMPEIKKSESQATDLSPTVVWGGYGYSTYHAVGCPRAPQKKSTREIHRSEAIKNQLVPCPFCKPNELPEKKD